MNHNLNQEGEHTLIAKKVQINSNTGKESTMRTNNDIRQHGPRPPQSFLARLQLSRARTREEMRKLAADVWRQRGLALIDPLLIENDFARQALINEATRLYGRKNQGNTFSKGDR